MPAPLFTSNPAEYLRHPGLYITEVAPPGFISGVALGTVGVIGQTLRGPVNTPVEITSIARFTEVFGHRSRYGSDTEANFVRQFLINKRFGKVVVVRAAAAAAATAEMDFDATATPIINVAATSPGAWGNDLTVAIEAATSGVSTEFNLVVNYRGTTTTYRNLTVDGSNNNLASEIGTDLGNLVVVTKLANGRPDNAAAAALTDTAGSDGSIADADYTGTDDVIDQIKAYPGVAIVASADRMTAAVKGAFLTAAAAASDRIFLLWSGTHSDSIATAVTDAASYRDDRIVYCFNSPYIIDPETAEETRVPPVSFMASVLAMTDVDVDPIDQDNKQYLTGISRLTYESITRESFITLKEAGICAIEKLDGFNFAEGVLNYLVAGQTRITRRRSCDFLVLSAADRLKYFVGKKNTIELRIQMGGELTGFSQSLLDQGRVVEDFSVDQISQNTAALRAQGQETIFWQVKLIGHALSLVLKAEIGETVTIQEAA